MTLMVQVAVMGIQTFIKEAFPSARPVNPERDCRLAPCSDLKGKSVSGMAKWIKGLNEKI